MILPKTEENYDMLFSLGTFDNAAQMNARKTPFNEAAQRLRTQWKSIQARVDAMPAKDRAKELRARSGQLLKTAASAMMIQKGEIGLIMAVAKVSDEVWQPLSRILNGQTQLGEAGVPKSSAAFTKMAKIPDEHLIGWLNEVVDGSLQIKDFKAKCSTWKNARKLWEEVTEICKDELRAPEAVDEKAWRKGLSSEAACDLLGENQSMKELSAGNFLARCLALVRCNHLASCLRSRVLV